MPGSDQPLHARPTVMRGHGRPGGRVRGVRRSASGYESPRWGDAIEMGPGELVLSGSDPDASVGSQAQRSLSSWDVMPRGGTTTHNPQRP